LPEKKSWRLLHLVVFVSAFGIIWF
jgi:hypothetical protein